MESQLRNLYGKLKELVDGIEGDVQKADEGNKSAGTRVRKSMQEVKDVCQDIRKEVLAARS